MFASLASLIAALLQPTGAVDGPTLARACEGKDGWNDPAPPARVMNNTYYVGTCGISAILVIGNEGHILIDGTTAEAAPQVAANIERLGFRLRDIRLILISHEHNDHVGGVAALQPMTGAIVIARRPALRVMRTGVVRRDDPQPGSLPPFPGLPIRRTIREGEYAAWGGLRLMAHATPGHSPGSTSWSWVDCRAGRCARIVYADSISAVSADGYRFSDHRGYVARFRRSIARIASLECDLLLTPHPGASNFFERLSQDRLVDPAACRDYAARATARLDARLAQEAGR